MQFIAQNEYMQSLTRMPQQALKPTTSESPGMTVHGSGGRYFFEQLGPACSEGCFAPRSLEHKTPKKKHVYNMYMCIYTFDNRNPIKNGFLIKTRFLYLKPGSRVLGISMIHRKVTSCLLHALESLLLPSLLDAHGSDMASAPCLHVGLDSRVRTVWDKKAASYILGIGCLKRTLDGSCHHCSRIRSS